MPDPLVRLPTGALEARAQQELHQREFTALQEVTGGPAPLAAELELSGESARGALFTPDGRFVLLWTPHL